MSSVCCQNYARIAELLEGDSRTPRNGPKLDATQGVAGEVKVYFALAEGPHTVNK